jgi:imidazolonepropionase
LNTRLISNINILAGLHSRNEPLRGNQLSVLPAIENAWLLVEGETIAGFGDMSTCPKVDKASITDASGCIVLPGWCDSHTHLVFAATRENEFVDKIRGASYEEIAAKGGGILNSAARLRNCPEDELFKLSLARLKQVMQQGTTSIEIKSGYGLDTDSELKMLRVIRRLREETGMLIGATFLGAHAFPMEYRSDHAGYIRLIVEEMLPAIQRENLADYIDVFCENGFFNTTETAEILEAGKRYGLKPKIHANQLSASGGVEVGIKHNAVSVDHLESMDDSPSCKFKYYWYDVAISSILSSDEFSTSQGANRQQLPGCPCNGLQPWLIAFRKYEFYPFPGLHSIKNVTGRSD